MPFNAWWNPHHYVAVPYVECVRRVVFLDEGLQSKLVDSVCPVLHYSEFHVYTAADSGRAVGWWGVVVMSFAVFQILPKLRSVLFTIQIEAEVLLLEPCGDNERRVIQTYRGKRACF